MVVAVALLTGIAGNGLLSALNPPGRGDGAVRWHLHRLVDEIARYRREVGRVPPSLEALGLGEAPADRGAAAGAEAPRGRGLKLERDGVPLDPWGQPYVYTVLDEDRGAFELRCAADDTVLETADDVVAGLP
ncbi:MAG: type II secretion system protein GspG [Planctomycetota bacterium]